MQLRMHGAEWSLQAVRDVDRAQPMHEPQGQHRSICRRQRLDGREYVGHRLGIGGLFGRLFLGVDRCFHIAGHRALTSSPTQYVVGAARQDGHQPRPQRPPANEARAGGEGVDKGALHDVLASAASVTK